jgi:hypothetical protein
MIAGIRKKALVGDRDGLAALQVMGVADRVRRKAFRNAGKMKETAN